MSGRVHPVMFYPRKAIYEMRSSINKAGGMLMKKVTLENSIPLHWLLIVKKTK
jgi:hypothetical protein